MNRLYKLQVHPPGSPTLRNESRRERYHREKTWSLKWKDKMCPPLYTPSGQVQPDSVHERRHQKWDAIRAGPRRIIWLGRWWVPLQEAAEGNACAVFVNTINYCAWSLWSVSNANVVCLQGGKSSPTEDLITIILSYLQPVFLFKELYRVGVRLLTRILTFMWDTSKC